MNNITNGLENKKKYMDNYINSDNYKKSVEICNVLNTAINSLLVDNKTIELDILLPCNKKKYMAINLVNGVTVQNIHTNTIDNYIPLNEISVIDLLEIITYIRNNFIK